MPPNQNTVQWKTFLLSLWISFWKCTAALHFTAGVNAVYLNVVVHEAAGVCKIRVFRVDVRQLDGHQVVNLQRKSVKMSETNLKLKDK